jgi:hypothetical protein
MNIDHYEQNFNKAKQLYHEIMKGENDAALLIKWLIESDTNPWQVFHEGASQTATLEGLIGLYYTIHHAIYDDGEITFVKTSGYGPKILFCWKHEKNFQEHYNRFVQKGCENIFEIVGYCENVQEFIQEFNEYNRLDKEYEEFYSVG